MLMRTSKLALVCGALMVTTTAFGSDAGGEIIGFTCNGCHGTDGVSKGAVASVKGMPAQYLEQAMKDYKTGSRPSTIMGRIARGYSDAELAAVAQYYSGLK